MLNDIRVKPLKFLTKRIFSGAPLYSITKLTESIEGIPIINIKDIVDGQIAIDDSSFFSIENFRNAERYMAYPGDVIITCRGTQLKIAVIPDNIERSIISANLIAIRLNAQLLPIFLAAYLKTNEGQKSLLAHTASSTMQIVLNVSDMGEIDVPVPSLSLQKKIVKLINAADEYYRLSLESANMRRMIANQVMMDMITNDQEGGRHGKTD